MLVFYWLHRCSYSIGLFYFATVVNEYLFPIVFMSIYTHFVTRKNPTHVLTDALALVSHHHLLPGRYPDCIPSHHCPRYRLSTSGLIVAHPIDFRISEMTFYSFHSIENDQCYIYTGHRSKDAFISSILKKEGVSKLQPVEWWKAPNTLQ